MAYAIAGTRANARSTACAARVRAWLILLAFNFELDFLRGQQIQSSVCYHYSSLLGRNQYTPKNSKNKLKIAGIGRFYVHLCPTLNREGRIESGLNVKYLADILFFYNSYNPTYWIKTYQPAKLEYVNVLRLRAQPHRHIFGADEKFK